MNIDDYISTADLARILGITRQAITKKLKENKSNLKTKQVGTGFLYQIGSLPQDIRDRVKNEQETAKERVLDKKTSKQKNQHTLSLEKELWAAADKLRGNVSVYDYKNIVLGLIFLKYISDMFYARRLFLESESKREGSDFFVPTEAARKSILDTKDFYSSDGVFYVPEKSRWEYLQSKVMSGDIAKILDGAMDLIEKENDKQLLNVLPKVYVKANIDNSILGELINIFSRVKFTDDFKKEKEILGFVYEYFLGQFADSEGRRGGEYFSPKSIVKLLVEIIEPREDSRLFDASCGSGGMFVTFGEYLEKKGLDKKRVAIYGQELNQDTFRLCRMNLAIHGLSGNIEQGNSYYQDKFPNLQADFILANPPFNSEYSPSKLAENDPRIILGVPPSGNANFLWVQHFVHHLAPNGYAGFVMPNGALAVSGKEGELRKKLIELDLVDVIVSCPSKLFYNVSLPVSLWFIANNKNGDRFRKRKGETLFIDARDTFEQISKRQVIFNDDHIAKIGNIVKSWRGEKGSEKYEDVAGFCKSAKLEDIAKNGYVLTPGRYVGLADVEDDGISFEEKMSKLSTELREAFKKGHVLEKEIESNLKELGF